MEINTKKNRNVNEKNYEKKIRQEEKQGLHANKIYSKTK